MMNKKMLCYAGHFFIVKIMLIVFYLYLILYIFSSFGNKVNSMRNKFVFFSLGLSSVLFAVGCNNQQTTDNSATTATGTTQQPAQHPNASHETGSQQAAPADAPVTPPVSQAATSIPNFTFYKVKSGIAYTKDDLPAGKNTVFLLFDPGCNHCQQETAALAKRYDQIKDVNILYVSMNDPALMTQFFSSFGKELEGKENVEMLWDRNQDFIQKFHIPDMFPANYVYGPDGQLKASWEGEKPIEEIIAEFTK